MAREARTIGIYRTDRNGDLTPGRVKKTQPIDAIALQQALSRDPSILVQSSGVLALRTMGADPNALISNITKHQLQNGSWNDNPFFTAWALMALRGYL